MAEIKKDPLHNEEAEIAVLGSLMIDPSAIAPVTAILNTTDFYAHTNRIIYNAIVKLGDKADLLTVAHELERIGQLDKCGGEAYLAELSLNVPTALNVATYAELVVSASLRRKIVEAAQLSLQAASDPDHDDNAVVDSAQSYLNKAIRHHTQSKQITKSQAIDEWRDRFDNLLDGNVIPGIKTGIREIDYKIGGWKPGKLYIFAGKPGSGKTTIMLNFLINAARYGTPCAILSCEMTETELAEVCIANLAYLRYQGVNLNEGHVSSLPADKKEELRAAAKWAAVELERIPLHLRCVPGMTPAQFRYECKALKQSAGIEIAAADYIQIMVSGLPSRDTNREREIAYITEELKRISMDDDLRIAVMAGSQVNETGDLRESRAIGHHADVVVYLTCEANKLTANFGKNRRGPTGEIDLMFNKAAASIRGVGM